MKLFALLAIAVSLVSHSAVAQTTAGSGSTQLPINVQQFTPDGYKSQIRSVTAIGANSWLQNDNFGISSLTVPTATYTNTYDEDGGVPHLAVTANGIGQLVVSGSNGPTTLTASVTEFCTASFGGAKGACTLGVTATGSGTATSLSSSFTGSPTDYVLPQSASYPSFSQPARTGVPTPVIQTNLMPPSRYTGAGAKGCAIPAVAFLVGGATLLQLAF